IASVGEKPVLVTKGSYLTIDLSAKIQDTPEQMEGLDELTEAFGGDSPHVMQLRAMTRALDAAAKDTDIAGVYLRGNPLSVGYGSDFAALKELREAVERFK